MFDAIDVSFAASGCSTEEPTPEKRTANISIGSEFEIEISKTPVIVKASPIGKNHALGLRSKRYPQNGCIMEAEIWYVSVTIPICEKLSARLVFKRGYIAEITDCMVSLRQWARLNASSIP